MTPARTDYPRIPDKLALAYVTLTMLIMAYSPLFKIFPILIFLMMWLSHVYYKRTFILRPSRDLLLVLAFPFLCAYSTLWSEYPAATFYGGIGLMIMVFCTSIIARTVRTEPFIKGVTLGTSLTLSISLLYGHFVGDAVRLFGSKNEIGFYAELGIFTSILALFSHLTFRNKIVFAIIPLLISVVCLVESKSASSVLSLTIALAVTFGVYLLDRMPRQFRLLAFCAAVFTILTFAVTVSALDLDMAKPVLNSFGKDSTLTGRTYLWSEGIRNGLKRPILGYGYFGFWQPGRPEAEQYWHEFDIQSKSGFHFHNLLIQAFVDFGFTGLALIVFLILASCYKSIRAALRSGMNLETGYAIGISFLFLVRAFVEVDIFGPFGIGPFLYFSIIPRLARNVE